MELTGFILLCFGLRVLPRLLLHKLLVSDTYFHLGTSADIRRNNFRVPDSLSYFVLPNKHRYPFLFHWLWALLPVSTWRFFECIAGALFDTLVLIVVYVLAMYADATAKLPGDFPDVPFMAAALYATAPALLRTGDGPRAYNMSPRIAAMLLYLVHIFPAWYYTESGNITALTVSLVAGALLYIFAIFSVQVLLLFMIPLAVFWWPLYPVLVLAAFVLSILLSFGRSPGIFVANRKHSVFYARVQRHILYPRYKTVFAYVTEVLRKTWGLLRHRQWGVFRDWFFVEPHYLHLLVTVFPFIPLVLVAGYGNHYKHMDSFMEFLLLLTATGTGAFLLTKHKPFLFLGSGERYLEYVLVPAFILFAALAAFYEPVRIGLYVWLGYSLIAYCYHAWYFVKSNRTADAEQDELKTIFLQFAQFPEGNLLPVNANHSKLIHYFAPDRKILVYQPLRDEERLPEDEYKRIYGNGYNYPAADLQYIIDKYSIRYLFGTRRETERYVNTIYKGDVPFAQLFKTVCETEGFVILERVQ